MVIGKKMERPIKIFGELLCVWICCQSASFNFSRYALYAALSAA
jgi:hypothetical protein